MPGRDVARQGARLKCSLEPVSDIMGHCFVVGDNICDISCVPGTLPERSFESKNSLAKI